MFVGANRTRLGDWLRGPTVLLCCVLSITAPCDLTAVGQWLDSTPPAVGLGFVEVVESIDETHSLLRASGPGDSYRLERRLAQGPLLAFLPTDAHGPAFHSLFLFEPTFTRRPGCEHAFRNGCGSYLRC